MLIKARAKDFSSRLALRVYLQRLLSLKGAAKTEKAQLLINSALKFHYRDADLWQLLGEVYDLHSLQ